MRDLRVPAQYSTSADLIPEVEVCLRLGGVMRSGVVLVEIQFST